MEKKKISKMSLIAFDNIDYDYTSSTTTTEQPHTQKAVTLLCKCKRNLDFGDDDGGSKIQCLEKNCMKRINKNGYENEEWHPLNGTR